MRGPAFFQQREELLRPVFEGLAGRTSGPRRPDAQVADSRDPDHGWRKPLVPMLSQLLAAVKTPRRIREELARAA